MRLDVHIRLNYHPTFVSIALLQPWERCGCIDIYRCQQVQKTFTFSQPYHSYTQDGTMHYSPLTRARLCVGRIICHRHRATHTQISSYHGKGGTRIGISLPRQSSPMTIQHIKIVIDEYGQSTYATTATTT